ncbi:MAG: hypothetical protein JO127_08150 [Caulobacteraceae bacterium]|nr:hypothetical protein [Caulobacteraceae bacterium]
MIRGLFTGIAAFALMAGAAFAQDSHSSTTMTDARSADAAHWTPASDTDGPYYRDRADDRDGAYDRDAGYYRRHHASHPGAHALGGGMAGAGLGAAIGCIVTIPIGCAPGAAVGAAVGGGTGAIAGAATTPRR